MKIPFVKTPGEIVENAIEEGYYTFIYEEVNIYISKKPTPYMCHAVKLMPDVNRIERYFFKRAIKKELGYFPLLDSFIMSKFNYIPKKCGVENIKKEKILFWQEFIKKYK